MGPPSVPALQAGLRALPGRLRAALARRFEVDTRALGAFRVALGLLVLADLALRAPDVVAHYADAGVLPRPVLHGAFGPLSRLSLHALSGAAWAQAGLFVLTGGCALALAVGYRTRVAAVLTWLLLASLHLRNPLVLNAGDSLLRRLLLWGALLPLGERWSVDALRGTDRGERAIGLATAGLLCQVVVVYLVNAAVKLGGEAWPSGAAMVTVFRLDRLTVRLGDHLAAHPDLLRVLGRVWLAMLVGSVLLVALTGRARAAAVAAFAAAHLGMALTLRLGLFPLVSIAALLPFLPRGVWDRVDRVRPDVGRIAGRASGPGRASDPARSDRARPDGRGRPTVGRWRRTASTVLAAGLLVFVGAWNAAALGYADPPADAAVDPEERRWDMFAPAPRATDARFVVTGRLATGERVTLAREKDVPWDRPPDASVASHRWYLYRQELREPTTPAVESAFGDYVCDRWGDRRDRDLARITVTAVGRSVEPGGTGEVRRVALLEHACHDPAPALAPG